VGVLDDYAFTVIACLDAYETTADLSYFRFARAIAGAMIAGFYDQNEGGFFDTETPESPSVSPAVRGILGTPRKPFQDSPTPAGNPAAAIALLRLYSYTNEATYREAAERTLEVYAGVAGQHGIFAATYGLAVAQLTEPHVQVVIVGNDETATKLWKAAGGEFSLNTTVLRLDRDKVVTQNLPPVLAETIPNLPALLEGRSFAVVCSGFACQPPVFDSNELSRVLRGRARSAA
jgi:uncharacterized protein